MMSWLRPDPRRDLRVDTLRGLACLLVVAYHVRGGDLQSGIRIATGPWSYAVDSLVYVRMPLFTFLSGVVYAHRPLRGRYPDFVRGKARRLLVPLLVVGTVFAVTQRVTGTGDGTPWYLWHIVPVAHFWFLESVFWVFLLVALLDRFRLLDRPWPLVVVAAISTGVDAVLDVPGNVLGLGTAPFLLPFFLAGVAVVRWQWDEAPSSGRRVVVLSTVALLVWTQLGLLGLVNRIPEQGNVLASLMGVAACLSLWLVRRSFPALAVIGGYSFSVYTCHVFATAATRWALEDQGITSTTVHLLLGTAAGVAFGILVEIFARRWRWSRVLVLGRGRSVATLTRPAVTPG